AGLDDLRLGLATVGAKAGAESLELGPGRGQCGAGGRERARPLRLGQRRLVGDRRVERADAAQRLARRGGKTLQRAHQLSSERPSAATISAVEVAPGS